MNTDEEIRDFLQSERKKFEEKRRERSSGLGKSEGKERKKKEENTKARQKQLKEKWKEGKKEIKIACHNINGLKTKGWKLENLLGWANEEEITILGITETNL